jgi:hypothetical protein
VIAPPPQAGRTSAVALPLAYLATAAAALALAGLALPGLGAELAGHYYHPRLLALTHVLALGWITLAIFGATYQLVPVVIERPLWSDRVARWQLPAVAAGIAGMVGHFWLGRWDGLVWAAALVGAGALAHVANVALSLRGVARSSFTARSLVLALGGLALTVAFGVTLAATHGRPVFPGGPLGAVHAHFHLALLGWIAPMILGVSARVYPMFLVAADPGGAGAWIQIGGLGLGVPAIVGGLLLDRSALVVPGALAVASALAVHVVWVGRLVRQRRRPRLDWGLRLALTGTACAVPATALGLAQALGVAAGPRTALAYVVLGLGGWVSLTIAGTMLKIVPFLVWYRVHAPHAGRQPVPTLAQLSWPAAERLAYAGLTGGVLALAVAVAAAVPTAIEAAGLLVAAGALAFFAAVGRTLLHLLPGAAARRAAPLRARP